MWSQSKTLKYQSGIVKTNIHYICAAGFDHWTKRDPCTCGLALTVTDVFFYKAKHKIFKTFTLKRVADLEGV